MKDTFKGVATINLWAQDHKEPVEWYSELFGIKPYFEKQGYAEFRVGDSETEVGIIDSNYAPHLKFPDGPSGVVVYWYVDDVEKTLEHVTEMGAKELEKPQDRGKGFITATVVDPFGNILGIMHNPHYAEMNSKK